LEFNVPKRSSQPSNQSYREGIDIVSQATSPSICGGSAFAVPGRTRSGADFRKSGADDKSQKRNPEDKKPIKGVFALDKKRAVFTQVEIVTIGEDGIEIKSGLKEGQEIVSGPYRRLRTLRNYQQVGR
jgi:HlyD family secretion protein